MRAIIFGENFIVRGQLSGGQLSEGQLSLGAIVRGAIFLGGNCPDTDKFDCAEIKEVSFKENMYDFLVDFNAIDKSKSLNIHKFLMVKSNIKQCLESGLGFSESIVSIGNDSTFAQKQPPEVFCKKGALNNFSKFTGKHLCQSLFFNKETLP